MGSGRVGVWEGVWEGVRSFEGGWGGDLCGEVIYI